MLSYRQNKSSSIVRACVVLSSEQMLTYRQNKSSPIVVTNRALSSEQILSYRRSKLCPIVGTSFVLSSGIFSRSVATGQFREIRGLLATEFPNRSVGDHFRLFQYQKLAKTMFSRKNC
jgi:hypothetical protein